MLTKLPSKILLEWYISLIHLAKVEHLMVINRVLILMSCVVVHFFLIYFKIHILKCILKYSGNFEDFIIIIIDSQLQSVQASRANINTLNFAICSNSMAVSEP